MVTTATCALCELELHHCHGLVAVHDDTTFTCLDGCCEPLALHDDVVPCAELGLGCCAVPDEGEPVALPLADLRVAARRAA
jgi:hypothetical protein